MNHTIQRFGRYKRRELKIPILCGATFCATISSVTTYINHGSEWR